MDQGLEVAVRSFSNKFEAELFDIYSRATFQSFLPVLADCEKEIAALIQKDNDLRFDTDKNVLLREVFLWVQKAYASKILEEKRDRDFDGYLQEEKNKLVELLNEHEAILASKLKRAVVLDDYGTLVSDKREAEVFNFLLSKSFVERALERYSKDKRRARRVVDELSQYCREYIETYELSLCHRHSWESGGIKNGGLVFESWVETALRSLGWSVQTTKIVSDQGVDLIARKDGIDVAIQCKHYSGSVGNKAVQEVFAGSRHYGIRYSAVVSTGAYTKSASELASSIGVLLLTPQEIPSLHYALLK